MSLIHQDERKGVAAANQFRDKPAKGNVFIPNQVENLGFYSTQAGQVPAEPPPVSLDQHSFMTTFTGLRVDPTNLRVRDVNIYDIAHALSQLCRFTGHTREFYSVAQHSVLVAFSCRAGLIMEGLLHDAAEAYVNDLSRPLKHHPQMAAYVAAELRVDSTVRARFGLPSVMSPEVKAVDNKLVVDEALSFMSDTSWTAGHPRLYKNGSRITAWTPKFAEEFFLHMFFAYAGEL